jgi:hypothetical protein
MSLVKRAEPTVDPLQEWRGNGVVVHKAVSSSCTSDRGGTGKGKANEGNSTRPGLELTDRQDPPDAQKEDLQGHTGRSRGLSEHEGRGVPDQAVVWISKTRRTYME